MQRLMKIEEPLNHIMGIFFAIAPSAFVQQLFAVHCGVVPSGQLRLLGRSTDEELHLKNMTQPDFAFDGRESFLTIEAKIDSGSGVDQLVKYATLHQKAALKSPGRQHALLFLASKPQNKLFKEGKTEWSDMRELAKSQLTNESLQSPEKFTAESLQSISFMIDTLKLGYMNFADLGSALERQVQASANAEENNLYRGLQFELKRRVLC